MDTWNSKNGQISSRFWRTSGPKSMTQKHCQVAHVGPSSPDGDGILEIDIEFSRGNRSIESLITP